MKHLRLCQRTAYDYFKKSIHPEIIVLNAAIIYKVAIPQSIADQWWFLNCNNIPDELPDYLSYIKISKSNYLRYIAQFGERLN